MRGETKREYYSQKRIFKIFEELGSEVELLLKQRKSQKKVKEVEVEHARNKKLNEKAFARGRRRERMRGKGMVVKGVVMFDVM